jgi:hypothetical protein
MEIWKDIQGYEGLYSVSNFGRVKSNARIVPTKISCQAVCERILKPDLSKGYLRVTLSFAGTVHRFMVHRLVAQAFLQRVMNKPFVNHIDGNKTNNKVENLEWCSSSENEKHSHTVLGKVSGCSKKVLDRSNGIVFKNIAAAARHYGIKHTTLSARLRGVNPNNTHLIFAE